MPFNFPEISQVQHVIALITHAQEMRDIVTLGVTARSERGREDAVFQVARELKIKPRRVVAILRGEITRFWADEMDAAREWFGRDLERQAERLAHQAELYRMRRASIMERHVRK